MGDMGLFMNCWSDTVTHKFSDNGKALRFGIMLIAYPISPSLLPVYAFSMPLYKEFL